MSVLIAIKEKDKVYLGSDKQASGGNIKIKATKVYPIKGIENASIGIVGSLRSAQILSVSDEIISEINALKDNVTTEYIIKEVYTNIYEILDSYTRIQKDDKNNLSSILDAEIIIAYKDKAWVIEKDGVVMEITDHYALGSGMEVALGVLETNRNKAPKERIKEAIKATNKHTIYVDNDVEILTTSRTK